MRSAWHRALALLALVTASSGGAAFAAGRVPAAFEFSLQTLRAARIPILLPTVFAQARLNDPKRTFVTAVAGEHVYSLQIDDTIDCNGANVCSEGRFLGTDAVRPPGHSEDDWIFVPGRRVKLAGGLVGGYSETVSGASGGGNSYLRFTRTGARYGIVTRIASQTELVKIANSAIQNGVVRP